MSDTTGKYTGPTEFSIKDEADILVDLQDNSLQGYLREKENIDGVEKELTEAMPTYASTAGIHPDAYAEFIKNGEHLSKIRKKKAEIDKAAEVLRESEIHYEDLRERFINRVAKNVDDVSRDEGKPALLAVFGKTLKYRSERAQKAAATRRKNEEAKAAAENKGGDSPGAGAKPGDHSP